MCFVLFVNNGLINALPNATISNNTSPNALPNATIMKSLSSVVNHNQIQSNGQNNQGSTSASSSITETVNEVLS